MKKHNDSNRGSVMSIMSHFNADDLRDFSSATDTTVAEWCLEEAVEMFMSEGTGDHLDAILDMLGLLIARLVITDPTVTQRLLNSWSDHQRDRGRRESSEHYFMENLISSLLHSISLLDFPVTDTVHKARAGAILNDRTVIQADKRPKLIQGLKSVIAKLNGVTNDKITININI